MMKKTNILIIVALFTCLQSIYSQISTNELPISIQKGFDDLTKGNDKGTISLTVPNMKKVLYEDSLYKEKHPNGIQRSSVPIPMNLDLINDGIMTSLEDGGKLWQKEIYADKAWALDFVFSKFWLPKGGKFFIFNPLTRETIGAITSQYLLGEQSKPNRFSTGIIKGDKVVLEYYQPAGLKELPVIIVEKTYYTYSLDPYFNSSCDCEVNVNCSEGSNWQFEKNAVALVHAKFNQGGFFCSGALVNNVQKDLTPLFLTANHCLELDLTDSGGYYENKDAIDDYNLSDWVFYWGYETDSCNATIQPSYDKTTVGAIVKANNSLTDFALLQLQQNPLCQNGFIPYYLGWDASGNSGTGGVSIHHPDRDVKKISTYSCTPLTVNYNNNNLLYWGVQWIETVNGHGIVELGSSGAPLINNNHKVIGQIAGTIGNPTCTSYDLMCCSGKLSVSWTGNGNIDNRRRLDHWLNPNGNNILIINGLFPYNVIGPNELISTSEYGVFNLPTGFSVTWSLSGDNASNFTLQSNTPSTNQCTITRKEDVEFSGSSTLVLSAQVAYNGIVVYTGTKTICAPYISGETNPCLTDVYTVEGLSNNYTVSWDLSGSGYSVIQDFIPNYNTENNNYLGVQRTSAQSYANGTITATLLNGNNAVGTLTKDLTSADGFVGTWFQSSSLSAPYIPDSIPEVLECRLHSVTLGKQIVLQSDDFIGATITGNTTISHNYNIVSFCASSSGTIYTIQGYKQGTCDAYRFRFLATTNPIIPMDLNINSTGRNYTFSVHQLQDDQKSSGSEIEEWKLTIVQSQTGQTMYNGMAEGKLLTVNTSGWKPGVYIAIATANECTITRKLAIID